MGPVEIIGKGFRIAAKSVPLVLVLFGFGFAWNLLTLPFASKLQQRAGENAAMGLLGLVFFVVFVLISVYLQGGSVGFIHSILKNGQASLREFHASASRCYLRLLAVGALVGLIFLILGLVTAFALLAGGGPSPLGIVVIVAMVSLGLAAFLFVFLAPYAVVADNAQAIASIRRSIETVKRNFVRCLLLVIMMGLIWLAVSFILSAILSPIFGPTPNLVGQITAALLGNVIFSYLGVVFTASFMMLYLDIQSGHSESSQPPVVPPVDPATV